MSEEQGQSVAVVDEKEQNAVIAPPRLKYHPLIEERFSVDKSTWKVLVEAVWPNAKTPEAVVLALGYCKARGLDPLKKVVHIVPMWNAALGRMVETVWPGIADHRITATRTGEYGGVDPTVFGGWVERKFEGKDRQGKPHSATLRYPNYAQVTIYRIVKGHRVAFAGPTVYFRETFSEVAPGAGVPNQRWQRSPSQMLEKCAEAAALRRAFPEELGGQSTAEEMEGKILDAGGVDPQQHLMPLPDSRSDAFARLDMKGDPGPVAEDDAQPNPKVDEERQPAKAEKPAPKGKKGKGEAKPKEPDRPKGSEPLDRGLEVLSRTKRVTDIADLRATIAEELSSKEELDAWDAACDARGREIAG